MTLQSTFSKRAAWAILSLLLVIGACRKADNPVAPPNTTTEGTVTTTIAGQVVDESGTPIAGVQVTAYGLTKTTDPNGLFAFPKVTVAESRAFVIAKKTNFFNAARAAAPTANGVTYMRLMMAGATSIGTLSGTTGGMLTLSSGGSVSLAAGGVVTSSGAAYSGSVTVYARHLDPPKPNFAMLFAGDMTGQQTDGSQTQMQSFGVIIAELHASNGDLLQPASGKPATITLPISASMQSTAPSSIPLWYFDETLGMWKQEGSATKLGSTYSGAVQHFSFWNYDMSVDWAWITGQIVCSDVPIPGVVVNMGAYVEGGQPFVITDGNGKFRVKVPPVGAGGQAVLQVLASENHGLYFTNTPMPINVPAHVTTDLGQIALSSPCPSYLDGLLRGCSGEPVDGMVVATWTGGMSYMYATGGTFRMIAPANMLITISATNSTTGDVAQPQTITTGSMGSNLNAPTLIVCSSATDVLKDITFTSDDTTGHALTFSPDGSSLATLAKNGTDVIIFDATSGAILHTIGGAFDANYTHKTVQFSADGSRILTFESSGPEFSQGYFYPTYGSFDCWTTGGTHLTSARVSAYSAIFAFDGNSVFYSTYGDSTKPGNPAGVLKYDLASGTNTVTYSVNNPNSYLVGLAGGGSQFLMIQSNGGQLNAIKWDAVNDKKIDSFALALNPKDSNQYGYYTGSIVLSHDGSILGVDNGQAMDFYNVASHALLNTSTIPSCQGLSFTIAPDGARFLGQLRASPANIVALFRMTDGGITYTFDAAAGAGYSMGVALSPDGTKAAAAYANSIRIWKVQ